jgi:hypothetical protein
MNECCRTIVHIRSGVTCLPTLPAPKAPLCWVGLSHTKVAMREVVRWLRAPQMDLGGDHLQ